MTVNVVVDTNVAIVANGRDGAVRAECKLAAIMALQDIIEKKVVCLDSSGEIQTEYRTYLDPKGQPGVGDRFFQEVINSHPKRVKRVDLEKLETGEFRDVPNELIEVGFDPSDRKFVAVAKKAKALILNAVDSDWLDHKETLIRNGVKVKFVCGEEAARRGR